MIAKSRLILPRPDLVPLGLFLSPHNTDICSDSRRLILGLFRLIPSIPLSPPDTAGPEVVDTYAHHSDYFDSKATRNLTKRRLLSLVVLHEWETISTEWKDLLAAEVLNVDRMDVLAGEFDLSEFMVATGSNSDSGSDSTKYAKEVRTFPYKTSFPSLGSSMLDVEYEIWSKGQFLQIKKEPSWSCFASLVDPNPSLKTSTLKVCNQITRGVDHL